MAKKFDIKKISMAAGGGALAQVLANKYEAYQVENGKEVKPKQTAGLIAGVGAALTYFFPKYEAVGLGMIGSGAGELADEFYADYQEQQEGGVNGANRIGATQSKALTAKIQEIRRRLKPGSSVDARGEEMKRRMDRAGLNNKPGAYRPYGQQRTYSSATSCN